jgi:hypothetical protein
MEVGGQDPGRIVRRRRGCARLRFAHVDSINQRL